MPPPIIYEILVDAGVFALAGQSIASRRLSAETGSVALTGSNLEFGASNTLMASGVNLAFINEDVFFTRTPPALNAQSTTFSISGIPSSGSRVLSASSGTYVTNSAPVSITPPPPRQWFGPIGGDCMCQCSCVIPHVEIRIIGSSVFWEVTGADSASLFYQCNTDLEAETVITLTAGAASGSQTLGVGFCSYRIEATNACGTARESTRNYQFPQCDCLHVDNESPTLWDRTPPVLVSVNGNSAASGPGWCTAPRDCPSVGFTAAMYCTGPTSRRFRITKPTGCFSFNTFIEIDIHAGFFSYPSPGASGVYIQVLLRAYWYRRGAVSSTSYYPTLTEITPFNTPVPWEPDTVFGHLEFNQGGYSKSWTGGVSNTAFIGPFPTLKCPDQPLYLPMVSYDGGCRNINLGGPVDCDPLICVPDFNVTAVWQ